MVRSMLSVLLCAAALASAQAFVCNDRVKVKPRKIVLISSHELSWPQRFLGITAASF